MYLDLIISDKVKAIIEKTCQFLLENGTEHEEYLLKSKSANDENFGFLFQENPYHIYYKTYWEWLKGPDSATKKFDFYEIINKKQQKAPLIRLESENVIKLENLGINNMNNQNNPIVFNLNPLPQQNNNNFNNMNSKNPSIFNNSNIGNNYGNNFPTMQNNNNNNAGNQIKKKNRWSDSASNQNENANQNNNNNNNPNRPSNFYQPIIQNLNMNTNYSANCYNSQIPTNQIAMKPNIMNQMNVMIFFLL